jgi:N-dimethylarginine dimethylaminohydrolase
VPNVVLATADDAEAYGLNAMSDGKHIVLSDRARGLIQTYRDLGLTVWPAPIGEFQKSGGGVKCLSLEIRR